MTPGRTCPRYAVIDMSSGFVLGVVDAPNMFAACRQVAGEERDYVEIADGGFIVHLVPDDLTCDAGIDVIEAMPLAGYVRTLRTDEDQ
jgi:hypothetical protein